MAAVARGYFIMSYKGFWLYLLICLDYTDSWNAVADASAVVPFSTKSDLPGVSSVVQCPIFTVLQPL